MFTARKFEDGAEAGKWFTVMVERQAVRKTGYCAVGCDGHDTAESALAHHLQFQLDRETDMWLDRRVERPCEICGANTTLRARLGRGTNLFVLCRPHQSTVSLKVL